MAGGDPPRLDVLKALGDNTRYAIYLELARAERPRSTAEIAETLDLHPNTVRPHLERMREVGLLCVETESRGEVGRPHHRWSLAPDAPSLGLEPPAAPLLAGMLLQAAGLAGAGAEEAAEAGRAEGRRAAAAVAADDDCVAAVVAELARLGFDPEVATEAAATEIAFGHCPFAAAASANPELVCSLHRGMVEGFVESLDAVEVVRFRSLVDRRPCRVELVAS